MSPPEGPSPSHLLYDITEEKYVTPCHTTDKPFDAEFLSLVEEAYQILEKDSRMNCIVENITKEKIQCFLTELVEYQVRKELIYKVIIAYWLLTILLGLISMTIEARLTAEGMYVIWTGLMVSNVLLVVGHKYYDYVRVGVMVKKYSSGGMVMVNPLVSTV